MSHGDTVIELRAGSTLRLDRRLRRAAMGDAERRIYGVQFHPEVAHTEAGNDDHREFLARVAGLAAVEDGVFRRAPIAEIREQVGNGQVICALSGGVDSAVAATLVSRAIGEQLTCVFVDHGLLRKNEAGRCSRRFATSCISTSSPSTRASAFSRGSPAS